MANCRYCATDCPENGEHDRFFDCGLYTERKQKQPTNADRIRSMSDEELAEFLLEWISCDKEGFMCHPKEYKEGGKCNGRCVAGRIDWLRQPAEEETT